MKAMVINAFGDPKVFEQREVPKPVPLPKQVLVRVVATSVNPLDYQIRRGDYKAYVKLPAIIGSDVLGIIEAVGDGVTDFTVGDIERERIRPVVDSQMPLSEVARAHERIEERGVRGKIVLDPAG
jgi:NADPH:quinone reductase-like Zn-dependent oxidoreductase